MIFASPAPTPPPTPLSTPSPASSSRAHGAMPCPCSCNSMCGCYCHKEQRDTARAADAQRIAALAKAAQEVMELLEQHGSSIVPHLMDDDENAGERLRELYRAALGDER